MKTQLSFSDFMIRRSFPLSDFLYRFPESDQRRRWRYFHFFRSGDTKTLAKAQGIGAKTAARIVLELKDKVSAVATADGEEDVGVTDLGGIRDDALEALMVLGYQRQAAQKALAGCKGDTLEELMRAALKKIGSKM